MQSEARTHFTAKKLQALCVPVGSDSEGREMSECRTWQTMGRAPEEIAVCDASMTKKKRGGIGGRTCETTPAHGIRPGTLLAGTDNFMSDRFPTSWTLQKQRGPWKQRCTALTVRTRMQRHHVLGGREVLDGVVLSHRVQFEIQGRI